MMRFGSESKARMLGLKGLAIAAGLAVAAFASQASATTYLKLLSSSMNTTYQANISGHGNVYSNGVTFSAKNYDIGTGQTVGPAFDLFGFCVDVWHNITLGALNYVYASNQDANLVNPLPTDFGGNAVTPEQLAKLTNLIDTGYALKQQETDANRADTEMRLAAIQAAIWKIEVPSKTVTVIQAGLNGAQFATYQSYFNDYVTGNYTSLADANDRFYVISDGVHQSFGIAWPVPGVPEPGVWAMMLLGFGGVGAALRSSRGRRALAA